MEKEVAVFEIVKLTPIVTLDESYGKKEVHRNIALQIKKDIVNFRFVAQREGPNIMSVIIKNHKVILKTRNTFNR